MQSAVTFHDRQDDLDLDDPNLRWKIDLKMQVQAIPFSYGFYWQLRIESENLFHSSNCS